jgi:hypothetical protein
MLGKGTPIEPPAAGNRHMLDFVGEVERQRSRWTRRIPVVSAKADIGGRPGQVTNDIRRNRIGRS